MPDMKCLRLISQRRLEYVSQKIPQTCTNSLCLKVSYCGICRTDAKMWSCGHRDLQMPRVLGHEFCGTASDGRKYIAWPGHACRECELCTSGYENLCPDMQITGFHTDGGMAEYVSVPRESLIELPEGIPEKLAIFAEPMACCINSINNLLRLNLPHNEKTLLIHGGGTCGLLASVVAREYGLEPLIVEVNEKKRSAASEFAKSAELKIVANVADKRLFVYGMNAAAPTKALIEGINHLKPAGAYTMFSGLQKDEILPATIINTLHYRQVTLSGAYGCTKKQMEEALKIIKANAESISLLIEKIVSLKDVPDIMTAVLAGIGFRYIVDLSR